MQAVLTILGGVIAGGVGLLITLYQEKRRIKKDLKNLFAEIESGWSRSYKL